VNLLKKIWDNIVLALVGLIIVLLYLFDKRNKRISILLAELNLADTKEQVKKIEEEIVKIRQEVDIKSEEIKEVDKALEEVYTKRQALAKEVGKLTPKEIEDYWNE
jgi:peptidoglycan hydrolase CwlO-like protein